MLGLRRQWLMFFSITGLAWKTATAALPRLGDFFKISFPQTFPEPAALSIGEQFFTRTAINVLPFDDWGFKGILEYYGLPGTVLTQRQAGLRQAEPIYGTLPLIWFDQTCDSLSIDERQLNWQATFGGLEQTRTRFDYYRGDYGFIKFNLHAGGPFAERTRWRFLGSNFAYEGGYGWYGGKANNLGESIAQSYLLEMNTAMGAWSVNVHADYRKFLPGIVQAVPLSPSAEIMNWKPAGNLKLYRASLQTTAMRRRINDSTFVGVQQTNSLFGNYHQDSRYYYKGEAVQYTGRCYYERQRNRLTWFTDLEPFLARISQNNGVSFQQSLFTGKVGLQTGVRHQLNLQIGTTNTNWLLSAAYIWSVNQNLKINAGFDHDYAIYPIVYRMQFPANRPLKQAGFSYNLARLGLTSGHRILATQLEINTVAADYDLPFKNDFADTLFTFQATRLRAIFLTLDLHLNLPANLRITSRTTFSPEKNLPVSLMHRSRISQGMNLFGGNLNLYFAGEVHFWSGSRNFGWFEEIQQIGMTDVNYYTNNRLSFAGRVGGYIGDLHLFYAVYNAEGRSLSTIAGMPYRHQLKIFGVEWSFVD